MDPSSQGQGVRLGKRTEEMDVVWHDDIPAYQPLTGSSPDVSEEAMNVRLGQDWSSLVGAHGKEHDWSAVGRFVRGQMHGCLALRSFFHVLGGMRSVASALSVVFTFGRTVSLDPWGTILRPRRSVALRFAVGPR